MTEISVLLSLRQKSSERKRKRGGGKKLEQNHLELEKTFSNKSKKTEKPANEDLDDDRFADADNLDCGDSGSEINEVVSYEWRKFHETVSKNLHQLYYVDSVLKILFVQIDLFVQNLRPETSRPRNSSAFPLFCLPLYSLLSSKKQQRIFEPVPDGHRLVLHVYFDYRINNFRIDEFFVARFFPILTFLHFKSLMLLVHVSFGILQDVRNCNERSRNIADYSRCSICCRQWSWKEASLWSCNWCFSISCKLDLASISRSEGWTRWTCSTWWSLQVSLLELFFS